MGKIKVHELAQEVDKTSKESIAVAEKLGIEVKSHMSSLEDKDVELIKNNILGQKSNSSKTKKEESKDVK